MNSSGYKPIASAALTSFSLFVNLKLAFFRSVCCPDVFSVFSSSWPGSPFTFVWFLLDLINGTLGEQFSANSFSRGKSLYTMVCFYEAVNNNLSKNTLININMFTNYVYLGFSLRSLLIFLL